MTAEFKGTDRVEGVKANDIQVGGHHYAGALQHWDLIERYGVGYLEGCATKYIQRHRLKNGMQDLRKAQHYVQKLRELHAEGVRQPRGSVPTEVVLSFCADHSLANGELAALQAILQWQDEAQLEEAALHVRNLIARY